MGGGVQGPWAGVSMGLVGELPSTPARKGQPEVSRGAAMATVAARRQLRPLCTMRLHGRATGRGTCTLFGVHWWVPGGCKGSGGKVGPAATYGTPVACVPLPSGGGRPLVGRNVPPSLIL